MYFGIFSRHYQSKRYCPVLVVQQGSFAIRRSLPARPEPDDTFWTDSTLDLCSATLMKSSRRDLSNYRAKQRFILKNYQDT